MPDKQRDIYDIQCTTLEFALVAKLFTYILHKIRKLFIFIFSLIFLRFKITSYESIENA